MAASRASARQVGADEAVGHARELVELDVVGERHAAGVDGEDLAAGPVRSGTPMTISRSKRPGRRSASSSALARLVAPMTMTFCRALEAVHQRQQLRHDAPLDLAR